MGKRITPCQGDLSGGMNMGYTGKPCGPATGLYNYGFRDYQSAAARFTYRLKCLIAGFCFFALITPVSCAQQSIDLSKISEGKIEIDSKIITGNYRELIDALSLAIELTLYNRVV